MPDYETPFPTLLVPFYLWLLCYTAVFSVVTQRSSGGEERSRDDTKNGCVAD